MVTSNPHTPDGLVWSGADFVGGHPALDFLNTVADQGKTRTDDKLTDWAAVRSWAAAANLLAPEDVERFLKRSRQEGANELTQLRRFREDAYAAIAHMTGGLGNEKAASRLLGAIHDAIGRGTFEMLDDRFVWRPNSQTVSRWVDAAALAFERLLRSDDFHRVRQCGRCTWFFIDRGRGTGRRWCDMRTCGNRAKAEAFRER
jgi:predicted RNA-binding Zn ribbon-like protein